MVSLDCASRRSFQFLIVHFNIPAALVPAPVAVFRVHSLQPFRRALLSVQPLNLEDGLLIKAHTSMARLLTLTLGPVSLSSSNQTKLAYQSVSFA